MTVGKEAMQGVCMVPAYPNAVHPAPHFLHLAFAYADGPNERFARLTVPIRQTNSLLPTYAPDLQALSNGGGGSDPVMFKLDRAMGRDAYFENQRDWQGLLQSTDEAIRDGVTAVNIPIDRATAYEGLRRWNDAHRTLTDARAKADNSFAADLIDRAEAELKVAEGGGTVH